MEMFCYQCEQTAKGTGCTAGGVCGKSPEAAALQDLLVCAVKDIAIFAHGARRLGATDPEINAFSVSALFATLTNVNFDSDALEAMIRRAAEVRDRARDLYQQACQAAGKASDLPKGAGLWTPAADREGLLRQAQEASIRDRIEELGETVAGLQELITYGLKGAAAYLDHARILGKEDDAAYGMLHELLAYLATRPTDPGDLTARALATGELNLKAMELLDAANTGAYGHPEPTAARITPVKGKAILVSGHDLKDLEELLEQTEGKGINVYTHGEMLPALAYPGLKKHAHLVGNYGGAWQDQRREFAEFPGAILMTTNCLQKPGDVYEGRIFTCGLVGWSGVRHISERDFTPVIEAALAAPGFAEDAPEKAITVGFARQAVLGVADKVIEAVKGGAVRHFFLIGGCDGARTGRSYYTEFARAVPDDCIILTLACGKYRFNKLEFGDIGGIPRLLDVGQCNDAYSAVQIALALADAFETDVNGLPLSLILSWYEQKAVAILLTLLHLGIRNIRLGPNLPAFVSPDVLKVLHEQFNLMPITTPQEDLAAALA